MTIHPPLVRHFDPTTTQWIANGLPHVQLGFCVAPRPLPVVLHYGEL
jgi:hypothetical protein